MGATLTIDRAVLSLLGDQPSWGYEVRARFRERYATLVPPPRDAAVYDALDRLEQAGVIEPYGDEAPDSERARTHYRITPAGVAELRDWRHAELPEDDAAQELLVRMRSIPATDIEGLLELLDDYERIVHEQLKRAPCERRGSVGSWRRELHRLKWSAELEWVLSARPYLRKLRGRVPRAARS